MYACVFTSSSRTGLQTCTKISIIIPSDKEEYIETLKLKKSVTWVRFPVKAFPVPREVSKIEERHQDQDCFFQSGHYRN